MLNVLRQIPRFIFLVFCLNWFFAESVNAQFKLSGELRPRTEFRHGYKTLPADGAEPAFFTEQRSRLRLDYSKEFYEIGMSLQDVRIWGSQSQLNKSDGLFSVHEAWGEVNFNEIASLKAGRQELVYDDQRILGSVGWTAQGRSHDALLLKLSKDSRKLHAGFAFNQDMNPPEPAKLFDTYYSGVNNYKTLHYLWYHHSFNTAELSFLALNNGVQLADSSVNFTQTAGITAKHNVSDFSVIGAVFYQMGTDPSDNKVSSWLTSLNISYIGLDKLGLTLAADYLSGTQSGQEKNHSFNPLYGTHHKFYGFMDYFYVGNPHRQSTASHNYSTGLVDLFLKTVFKATGKTTVQAVIHEFYSPVTIVNPASPSTSLDNRLGTEIDFVFVHSLFDDVQIQVGYSHMFGSSSLEALKGGSSSEISNWAWVMLSFNPQFLSK